jgi:hypothetical protein
MNVVSRECYNLEGSIMDKRAAILSEELGEQIVSIGVRIGQIVQLSVPVWQIKTMRGMIEDRRHNSCATDLVSIEYPEGSTRVSEIWECIAECTEGNEECVYVYLIEMLAKLD